MRYVGRSNPELIDDAALSRWLNEAPRAAEYFEKVGAVRWSIIPNYPDYYQDAPGARLTGRYLTATFDGPKLGKWRDKLRVTPHFPVGTTYEEILSAGLRASAFGADGQDSGDRPKDLLSFGTGVVAGFLAAAVERNVDIRLEHDVLELIIDERGGVTGVIAKTPDGRSQKFHGMVVLATSGYDWDDELAFEYLGLKPEERGSVAPRTVSGDGFRLARQAGATIIEFPANRVPIQLGYATAGYPGFAVAREHLLPHTFIVDSSGRRFADDAVLLGSGEESTRTRKSAPAVLDDLGRAAPPEVWTRLHISRWRVPRGARRVGGDVGRAGPKAGYRRGRTRAHRSPVQ